VHISNYQVVTFLYGVFQNTSSLRPPHFNHLLKIDAAGTGLKTPQEDPLLFKPRSTNTNDSNTAATFSLTKATQRTK